MANFKVITNPHFGNYSTLLRGHSRPYEAREDNAGYDQKTDEFSTKSRLCWISPCGPAFQTACI